MEEIIIMNYLEKVYKKTIETGSLDLGSGKGMDIWQWDEGVVMYGLIKAYEKTKDKEILVFIKKWINYHLDKMDFGFSINTTAPLLGVLKLLECGEKDERYEKVCRDFANWCLSECARADRGTFEHTCTVNKYDNQIWADTLFMGCIFLIKWGLFIDNDMYIREATRQFVLHYQFLSDDETNLIYHGYDCNERSQKGVLWGRGNGWFTVASVEALNLLPKNTIYYDEIKANFLKHFESIIKYQNENGSWNTVINKPDTYAEMSVTSAFAYGIHKAVDLGVVDKKYDKAYVLALKALKSDIDVDGKVLHGSLGTCVMEDYKKYNDIKCGYSYFTQGLAMMALSCE